MIITDWKPAVTELNTQRCQAEIDYVRASRDLLSKDRIGEIRAMDLRIAECERWIMVLNRRATETMDSQQALTPREIELLDRGLGALASDYNEAPAQEIEALCERLKVFSRDLMAERAQREADLRKAFAAGAAWMSERTELGDGGAGFHVIEPSQGKTDDAAAEYARSKVDG